VFWTSKGVISETLLSFLQSLCKGTIETAVLNAFRHTRHQRPESNIRRTRETEGKVQQMEQAEDQDKLFGVVDLHTTILKSLALEYRLYPPRPDAPRESTDGIKNHSFYRKVYL